MRIFKILGLWFLLVVMASCQKVELPTSVTSSPEFTSSITFNGEVYTLSAGEMGLVQTSDYTISGSEISMEGKLSNPNCDGCEPGFKLTVKSPQTYTYSPSADLLSDLEQWDYAFNTLQDSTTSLSIHASSGDSGEVGSWTLNGEPLNNNPLDSLIVLLPEAGAYTLAFTSEMCGLSASRTLDFDGLTIPCYGNILQVDTAPTWFNTILGPGFNPVITNYLWSYGNNTVSTGTTGNISIPTLNGVNEMCVDIVDQQGCSVTACTSFQATPAGVSCSANILLYNPELSFVVQPSEAAELSIEFTDNSGVTYSSESQTNGTITLVSSEDYTEPTMPDTHFIKVTYQINCLLFDASGNGYPFSGTVVTAFETP